MYLDHWDDLDPITRSYTLVGAYLHHFSTMEGSLNRAIGKALGLNKLQTAALCANIQFNAKCQILQTVLGLDIFSIVLRDEYKKVIRKMIKAAIQRNSVAHDMFFPSKDGKRVLFFVIRAKGQLETPDVSWGRKDFETRFKRLEFLRERLETLHSRLNTQAIAKALMERPAPFGMLGGGATFYPPTVTLGAPGSPGLLSPPLPIRQMMSDTSAASDQTTPQKKPPKPEGSK